MNTIPSSQLMFSKFLHDGSFDKVYLLNAHISPKDRVNIVGNIKNDLKTDKKILVVSTQVIEAGVDVSFPIVFRDAAPPSSVTQANGRGNRNGEFGVIDSYLFLFKNDNNVNDRDDCDSVYRNMMTNQFKNDIKNKIPPISEKQFHERCEKYFIGLSLRPEQGKVNDEQNIVDDILYGKFSNIGKYKFIEGDPTSHTIYVGDDDNLWEEYVKTLNELKMVSDYGEREMINIKFKKIRGNILMNTINVREKIFEELKVDNDDVFGVYNLIEKSRYNNVHGLII